ncbi:SGNH/GDSL hydrolase family protein [Eubacterium xylanophilum]|uniref:SGNH/GDSL hydrolase family protein n=1 Tax=Eubacterium xylanophilum TaxID=39497 RepID=UPI00047C49C3|nr:SGNH/GDSL hydrolase family protein [Eubacterium xylanophilum]
MIGPVAPKDPVRKRPAIYMMVDKAIAGTPINGYDKRDIFYLEGRVGQQIIGIYPDIDPDFAGKFQDVNELRKIVHSISLTIDVDEEEYKDEYVSFTLHCYGKKDKYNSGTTFQLDIPCNGEEVVIDLEDIEFTGDDTILGGFYFDFLGEASVGKATLKFYLNDGYEAPKLEIDPPIDFENPEYARMLDRSVVSTGNNFRLKKAIEKARNGEKVTIAYIGGSITQGAAAKPINTKCYAYRSYEGFVDLFAGGNKDQVQYVKAGVGGTSSELGMIRYEADVTSNGEIKPDIVIVEFAVNDEGDETEGHSFESLVRKIAQADNAPAVIINFAVFMNDWNLEDRLVPIGEHYDLPMASVKRAVVPQFTENTIMTKRQYFYDIYHPTNDGHKVMADCLIELFKRVDAEETADKDFDFDIDPYYGCEFKNVILVDKTNADKYIKADIVGYDADDDDVQRCEKNMDVFVTSAMPNFWSKKLGDTSAKFEFDVKCKNILAIIKDSASNDFGKVDVFVDDKLRLTVDPLEVGWSHCNAHVVLNEEETADHHVSVRMHPGDEEKRCTLHGFGVTL